MQTKLNFFKKQSEDQQVEMIQKKSLSPMNTMKSSDVSRHIQELDLEIQKNNLAKEKQQAKQDLDENQIQSKPKQDPKEKDQAKPKAQKQKKPKKDTNMPDIKE